MVRNISGIGWILYSNTYLIEIHATHTHYSARITVLYKQSMSLVIVFSEFIEHLTSVPLGTPAPPLPLPPPTTHSPTVNQHSCLVSSPPSS